MKLGLEQLKKQYENDPKEKGLFEIDEEGGVVKRSEIEGMKEGESESIVHDELVQEAMDTLTEILKKESDAILPYAIENPNAFKKRFEEDVTGKEADVIFDTIDKYTKALSTAYDHLTDMYETALDQRMSYKETMDKGVDMEMKERLDARIHRVQELQKETINLLEYLESERVNCVIHGEKKGIFNKHNEENEENVA
ncbi:MAG: hypothetical protein WC099_01905 [Candidatus Paceibacterota bacterium]